MKRRISILLVLVMLLGMIPANAFAEEETKPATRAATGYWSDYAASSFAGGKGIESDPYKIATAAQLALMEKYPNSHFELCNNINLETHYWSPIQYFYGTLDGNGFTISGLTVANTHKLSLNVTYSTGFIGFLLGTVQNLYFDSPEIISSTTQNNSLNIGIIGSLDGIVQNVSVIDGEVRVNITSSSQPYSVGGIVGASISGGDSVVENCVYSGVVTSKIQNAQNSSHAGGIIGNAVDVTITGCCSSGWVAVSGDECKYTLYGGGIAGHFASNSGYAIITDCYSEMIVSGEGSSYVGGLIGYVSDGYIYNCYASGEVEAVRTEVDGHLAVAGGLIGYIFRADVENCFSNNSKVVSSTPSCTNQTYTGRLYGYNNCDESSSTPSVFKNCYANHSMYTTYSIYKKINDCGDKDTVLEEGVTNDGGEQFEYSEAFIKDTLCWGMYVSQEDYCINPENVWIYQSAGPRLHIELRRCSLTIVYKDYTGTVLDVHFDYHDKYTNYSVTSPAQGDLEASAPVVSGGISENTYEIVTYNLHEHAPGADATCTTQQICTACGAVITDIQPHSYTISVTAPNCTDGGYTTYTCSVCGDTYNWDFVAPLGHHLDSSNVCTQCGESFPVKLRDYTIYVYDTETAKPITGATVTFGEKTLKTDAAGAAKYQLEDNSAQTLSIKADSYPERTTEKFIPGDMPSTYIYLESDETGIYEAWCNGDNVLVVDSQINNKAPAKEARIVVKGRAKANITKYEIVQDDQILASSTDGVFEIKNPHFKQNTPVYVRMHTDGQDNNMKERKLNISVVGFSFTANLDDLLPFAAGLDIDFTEGVPLLDGVSFQIPAYTLGENGIFNVHADNERLLVSFGFEDDAFAEDMDGKSAEEIMKALRDKIKKQNNPKVWPKGKAKSEFSLTGGLALEFGQNAQVTAAYGEIHVGYELSYKWGKTFVVWVIPIYAGFKAGLEGELVMTEFGYDFENSEIMIPDLDFTLQAEISLYGGVGCSLVSAGVYGAVGGEITLGVKDLEEYFKYMLYGEMGLYARIDLFFWNEMEYRLPLVYDDIYGPNGQVKSKRALLSPENYETAARGYLEDRSDWLSTTVYADNGDAHGILQTSSYTAIEPRIVQSGDTIMMLFMDDDGSEGFNYQHLYFSVFDKANNTWGTPVRVDDSQLADLEYDVYADDTGIYLAYTKAPEITEENKDDYTQLMAGVEVYAARYDATANTFADHTNISLNDCFDSQPQVMSDTVVWINNYTNDGLGENANNVLMLAQKTESGWQQKQLDDHGATVTSMDLGTLDGQAYIAVIRDVDCDLTTEDRQLQLFDLEGSKICIATPEQTSEGVRFDSVGGQSVLQWFCASNIWQLSAPDQAPGSLFDQPEQGLSSEFKHLQLEDGQSVILFAKNSVEDNASGSSLYGVYNTDGQWGQAVPITEQTANMYVDAFDACVHNEKLLIAHIATEAVFTDEDILRTSNFLTSCIQHKNDLVVEEAIFLESELFEGSSIDITVPITNLSWQKLQNVTVQIQDSAGTVVLEQQLQLEEALSSGMTDHISFTLPKSKLTAGQQYSIHITTTDWTDNTPSNNATDLQLWYTDFDVTAEQLLQAGAPQVHYAVSNNGNTAGSGTLCVYKKAGQTTTVLHQQQISLDAGKTQTGMIPITDSFYTDGTTGIVYVSVEPSDGELYNFNNEQSLSVGNLTLSQTEDITGSTQAVPSPVVNEPYLIYDKYTGGNVPASATENGWSFTGILELDTSNYSYSGGTLQLSEDYLKSLSVGYHYYTLAYSLNDDTAEAQLILEITDSTPVAAALTVSDQAVKYDGAAVELKDLVYNTSSTGAVTTVYSTDGSSWADGLPTQIGEYIVKITVAQTDEYSSAAAQFMLTIVKGARAISVPTKIAWNDGWLTFSDSIPTADPQDGQISYGFSTENDPATVTQWSESGAVPTEDPEAIYYIFARITGGINYEDAYSLGYQVKAHKHSFTQSGCTSCGMAQVAEVYKNGKWVSGHESFAAAAGSCTNSNTYVRLCQDTSTELTLGQDLYVDLNGYDLTGTIRTNGYKLYGMDNTTDTYSCESIGHFSCTDENGTPVKPQTHFKTSMTGAVRRYVAVLSEGQYSFHRIYLGVTHMSARPSSTGVGFKAAFYADEMVTALLDESNAYGHTLQLSNYSPVSAYKPAESFTSGKTVTLRLENYDVERFGEATLYASVMLKLADGTVIESSQVSMTLRQLVEYMNDHTEEFSQVQLDAMKSMISKYPVMRSWKVDNLI